MLTADPWVTAIPPIALSMIAAAMRGLNTIITSRSVVSLRKAATVIAHSSYQDTGPPAYSLPRIQVLSEQPKFRQELPVHKVVQNEGCEKDRDQHVSPGQMESSGIAVA